MNKKKRGAQQKRIPVTADEHFDAVQELLPGSKVTAQNRVEGADRVVAHIKQRHYFDPQGLVNLMIADYETTLRGKIPLERLHKRKYAAITTEVREKCQKVAAVHEEIYETLTHLLDEIGFNRIYIEGYKEGMVRSAEPPAAFHGRQKSALETQVKGTKIFTGKEDLEYFGGAEMKLAMTKGIKLYGVEDLQIHEEAMKHSAWAGKKSRDDKKFEEQNRKREQKALEIMTQQGGNFNLLLYGKSHDFKKAVEEWNGTRKPKLSFIEITPNSIAA